MMPDINITLPDLSAVLGKSGVKFLQLLEVNVDDFIWLVQSNTMIQRCSSTAAEPYCMGYTVFPPPIVSGYNG